MPERDRLAALRDQLSAASLDAIVITHPSNRYYFSGYTAEDLPPNESAGHLVVTPARAIVVASTTNSEQARNEASGWEVFDKVRGPAKADVELLRQMAPRRVGFEEAAILYQDVEILRHGVPGADLVPVGAMLEDMRAIKSAEEIAKIARAIDVTDQAFTQVSREIKEGDTEQQVAWRLETIMRELGAQELAFSTIVAAGRHAAMPHHSPGPTIIRDGEPIVIDMGARVDGYCADLTRTVCAGEPDEMLRRIYPIVLRALESVEANLRAGLIGRDGDAFARDLITQAGYGSYFGHGLGHGVGMRVHESPSMAPSVEAPLVAGNVVTIEPGIYLPEWGGVRIEDVAVIEDSGARILTKAAKLELSPA